MTPSTVVLADHSIVTDPQTLPILHLHRHRDGYISLAAGEGDDFQPVVAIRRDEFENYFPQFREQLLKDSYVSINASWRLRRYGEHGRAYGYPKHDSRSMRYLCAAYCDLDFYKHGLNLGSVLGTVAQYQHDRKIPPASILVDSGRGLWVIWLIHQADDPSQAQGAFPEKVRLYASIQREIHTRMAKVGADAFDLARHIRVPGSFSTKCERVVEWWVQGSWGSAHTYTLDDLAAALGVDASLDGPIRRVYLEPMRSNSAKRRGWEALNARRLREFDVLRMIRGGFVQGHRNRAAMLYAWLLRCNGTSRREAGRLLERFAVECKPALSPSEIRKALASGYGKIITRMQDRTIADWLDIQVHEAELLESLPPASRFQIDAAQIEEPKRAKPAERHLEILAIVDELGRVPPTREMAEVLTQRGFPIRYAKVSHDYRALGLSSRKPKAEDVQTVLPLQGPEKPFSLGICNESKQNG